MRKTRAGLKSLINRRGKKKKKKKKEEEGGKAFFRRQLAFDVNIQKGKTVACDFSLHPLSLARWASPHFHLCLLTLAKLIRLKESTWENFKLLSIQKKKKKGIHPPTPLLSLALILRLIYETLKCLIPFGVENTLSCKP